MRTMPQLTRRRDPHDRGARRQSDRQRPLAVELRGLYPGSHPSEHARAIAETFDQARCAFEIAWRFFHAKRYGG